MLDGYDYFWGSRLAYYQAGWMAGSAMRLHKTIEAAELDAIVHGDPNHNRWVAEGSPAAGALFGRPNEWYRQNCRQRAVEWLVF